MLEIACKCGNDEMHFGKYGPCWLADVTGLGSDYNVYTTETSTDVSFFNGSKAKKRNIVITLDILKQDFAEQRNKMYKFYQPRAVGTLFVFEDNIARKINYYVESVTPGGTSNDKKRTLTISLICPNPMFTDLEDTLTQLASWKGLIQFPFTMTDTFKVTEKVKSLIANIYNGSSMPMGLTIKYSASGTVVNPSLTDVNRQLLLKVKTTMQTGDLITITTADGNKRATLTRGGVTTNINNLLVYPPNWLKAYQGDNLYRYDAESGINNLDVAILTSQLYMGV